MAMMMIVHLISNDHLSDDVVVFTINNPFRILFRINDMVPLTTRTIALGYPCQSYKIQPQIPLLIKFPFRLFSSYPFIYSSLGKGSKKKCPF